MPSGSPRTKEQQGANEGRNEAPIIATTTHHKSQKI